MAFTKEIEVVLPSISGVRLKEKGIFQDYESPYMLGRAIYRHLDCGPWIVFVDTNGQGTPYTEAPRSWEALSAIKGIKVGSIVEGSEAEVGPYMVDAAPFETFEKRLFIMLDEVSREVADIWEEMRAEDDCQD